MTDDLRTRAREAAEGRVRESGYPLEGPIANLMHIPAVVDSFEEGALWHAAQQPTREQIARAIAASDDQPDLTDEEAVHHYGHVADAVLALLGGPPDERNER